MLGAAINGSHQSGNVGLFTSSGQACQQQVTITALPGKLFDIFAFILFKIQTSVNFFFQIVLCTLHNCTLTQSTRLIHSVRALNGRQAISYHVRIQVCAHANVCLDQARYLLFLI